MINKLKPLTLEETALKEEMKDNCLKVGKYKDEKAKEKFEMLCHLENFEIEYWNLQQENEQLKNRIDKAIEYIKRFDFEYLHQCMEHNLVEALENLLEILKGSDKE